jgi:hypothetical protein
MILPTPARGGGFRRAIIALAKDKASALELPGKPDKIGRGRAFMSTIFPFTEETRCEVQYELGEGPTYDPATDTAWWFDIKGKPLHTLHFETKTKEQVSLPFLAKGLAVIATSKPSAYRRSRRICSG